MEKKKRKKMKQQKKEKMTEKQKENNQFKSQCEHHSKSRWPFLPLRVHGLHPGVLAPPTLGDFQSVLRCRMWTVDPIVCDATLTTDFWAVFAATLSEGRLVHQDTQRGVSPQDVTASPA